MNSSEPKDRICYLGLGSNTGDSERILEQCIEALEGKLKVSDVSSIFMTKPRGYEEQNDFLNCVVRTETSMQPHDILSFIGELENRFGRIRSFRNAPRTIDIDILLYGNHIIDDPELTVPHPRMKERRFVLIPLLELDWSLTEPGSNVRYSDYLSALEKQGIYYFNLNRYI